MEDRERKRDADGWKDSPSGLVVVAAAVVVVVVVVGACFSLR